MSAAMGEVVTFPDRRKTRRKTGGELYECIIPLTIFLYGQSFQQVGVEVQRQLEERLEGMQFTVEESLIRLAEIEHHKA
jgi:hypothetical protein